jgi:hypothetical protein
VNFQRALESCVSSRVFLYGHPARWRAVNGNAERAACENPARLTDSSSSSLLKSWIATIVQQAGERRTAQRTSIICCAPTSHDRAGQCNNNVNY